MRIILTNGLFMYNDACDNILLYYSSNVIREIVDRYSFGMKNSLRTESEHVGVVDADVNLFGFDISTIEFAKWYDSVRKYITHGICVGPHEHSKVIDKLKCIDMCVHPVVKKDLSLLRVMIHTLYFDTSVLRQILLYCVREYWYSGIKYLLTHNITIDTIIDTVGTRNIAGFIDKYKDIAKNVNIVESYNSRFLTCQECSSKRMYLLKMYFEDLHDRDEDHSHMSSMTHGPVDTSFMNVPTLSIFGVISVVDDYVK